MEPFWWFLLNDPVKCWPAKSWYVKKNKKKSICVIIFGEITYTGAINTMKETKLPATLSNGKDIY